MIEREHIERVLSRLPEIETLLSDPATAAKQTEYRRLVREHSALKKIEGKAEKYLSIRLSLEENRELAADESDAEMAELAASEIAGLEDALPDAEKALMVALLPPDPDAERNAIMEIRAGTGGDEAGLFAGDLFRMYHRFAEEHKWSVKIIDASSSEVGGYKEIIFSVTGDGAYGELQYESGVHRVQRVPATEAAGRIHTSAATVAVFPEADAQDDFVVPPDEVRVDIYRSSGPGGQSVNTTDSAVRLTHIPTGVIVQCQDEKSQHRNKERAMSVLTSRLLALKRQEEADRMGDKRRSQIKSGDRSERIRTYNFPQNRLTDHRIKLTLYSLDRIMEGDISELVNGLRHQDVEMRIDEELARILGGGDA